MLWFLAGAHLNWADVCSCTYLKKKNSCNLLIPIGVCCHFNLSAACKQWESIQTLDHSQGRWTTPGTQRASLALSTAGVQAGPSTGVFPSCLKDGNIGTYMLSDLDKALMHATRGKHARSTEDAPWTCRRQLGPKSTAPCPTRDSTFLLSSTFHEGVGAGLLDKGLVHDTALGGTTWILSQRHH